MGLMNAAAAAAAAAEKEGANEATSRWQR